MDNSCLILLMKNGSVKMRKESKLEITDKIKYILIPDEMNTSHILIKPNEYLKFTKATVEMELSFKYIDYGNDEDVTKMTLKKTNFETTSLTQLICYLQSLVRMSYTNNALGMSADGSGCVEFLDVNYYSIKIYDKDKIIYSSIDEEIKEDHILSEESEETMLVTVFKKINDFYKPLHIKGGEYIYIKPDYSWGTTKNHQIAPDINIGIYMPNNKCYYFIDSDSLMNIIDNFASMTITSIISFENELEDPDKPLENTSYVKYLHWKVHNIDTIIEYIINLRSLYQNILFLFEYCVYSIRSDEEQINIYTELVFNSPYNLRPIHFNFDKTHIPTIYDVFKRIVHDWSD